LQQLFGSGFESTFEGAKATVLDFTKTILTIDGDQFHFNPALLADVKAISASFVEILPHVARLAGALFDLGLSAGKAFSGALAAIAPILDALAGVVKIVSTLTDTWGK